MTDKANGRLEELKNITEPQQLENFLSTEPPFAKKTVAGGSGEPAVVLPDSSQSAPSTPVDDAEQRKRILMASQVKVPVNPSPVQLPSNPQAEMIAKVPGISNLQDQAAIIEHAEELPGVQPVLRNPQSPLGKENEPKL